MLDSESRLQEAIRKMLAARQPAPAEDDLDMSGLSMDDGAGDEDLDMSGLSMDDTADDDLDMSDMKMGETPTQTN